MHDALCLMYDALIISLFVVDLRERYDRGEDVTRGQQEQQQHPFQRGHPGFGHRFGQFGGGQRFHFKF